MNKSFIYESIFIKFIIIYHHYLMDPKTKTDEKLDCERPILYQRRWIILSFYIISVFVNNIPGEIYVSVSNDLIEIYDTSETLVTMASTSYMLMHPILSIPCS